MGPAHPPHPPAAACACYAEHVHTSQAQENHDIPGSGAHRHSVGSEAKAAGIDRQGKSAGAAVQQSVQFCWGRGMEQSTRRWCSGVVSSVVLALEIHGGTQGAVPRLSRNFLGPVRVAQSMCLPVSDTRKVPPCTCTYMQCLQCLCLGGQQGFGTQHRPTCWSLS